MSNETNTNTANNETDVGNTRTERIIFIKQEGAKEPSATKVFAMAALGYVGIVFLACFGAAAGRAAAHKAFGQDYLGQDTVNNNAASL